MEEIRKQILEVIEEINDAQRKLNDLRKQLADLEKEVSKQDEIEIKAEEVKLPQVSSEILEEAEKISFREAYFVLNLNRLLRKLEVGGIRTLRELYEWASDNNPSYIRAIGEKSILEIRLEIKDLSGVIEKVKKRRENIRSNDIPIEKVIKEEFFVRKLKNHGIRTLKELYDEDVRTRGGVLGYFKDRERQIIEIIQRY